MGQGQSRLKYQQAVGVLLAHPSLSPNDIAFWSQFWTIPATPDEVFEGISPADIRNIKINNPANLAILLHKAIGQLTAWIQRTTTMKDSKATHEFESALNCIRLITRILPFLFEDQADGFAENVFWNNKMPHPVAYSPSQSRSSSPFVSSLLRSASFTSVPATTPFHSPEASIPSTEVPVRDAQSVPKLNEANTPSQDILHNEITDLSNTGVANISLNQQKEHGSAEMENKNHAISDHMDANNGGDQQSTVALPPSPTLARVPLPSLSSSQNIPLPTSPSPTRIPLPSSPPPTPLLSSKKHDDDQQLPQLPLQSSQSVPTVDGSQTQPAPSPRTTPLPPPPPQFEWQDSTLGGGDQPLAARLLDTLLHLLFLPQFTISATPPTMAQIQAYQQSDDGSHAHEYLPYYYFWAMGIGAETVIPTPAAGKTGIWPNRKETLKCLLACFSQTLYTAPEGALTMRNRWLEHVVCKNGYFSKALFCSLFNVVCTYDPVGWGVPYNYLMFRDDHESVASIALQVLNVLLQYNQRHFQLQIQQQQQRLLFQQQQQVLQQYPQLNSFQRSQSVSGTTLSDLATARQSRSQSVSVTSRSFDEQNASPQQQSAEPGIHSPQQAAQQLLLHSVQLQRAQHQLLQGQQPQITEQQQNIMLQMLADMRRNKDFQLIIDSFMRLMANPIVATAARLPYSVKQLEWNHHILMLFWHMIQDNKKFLSYLITSDKCPQLLVPMLCFMIENRKDASSLGVIQLCTFILLLLSGERDFAVTLNRPIIGARLPYDLPKPTVPYTHFDLLAIVAYRVIIDAGPGNAANAQHLAPVRECLLTAIANVSPFVKGIGIYSALNLVVLFEKLADPQVLFSNDSVCRLVHLLLETFNNVIQYQFEANSCLIYAILRTQNDFSKLAHLKIVQVPPGLQTSQQLQSQEPQPSQETTQPQELTQSQPQLQPSASQSELQSELPQPQNSQPPQQNLQQSQSLQQSQNLQTSQQLQNSQTVSAEQQPPPLPHFVPTNEWLEGWKRTLPLDIILRMITMVSPKIQAVCTGSSAADENMVISKLQNTSLVGLLPTPHPILIRKYQSNDATQTWLLSYLWGSIFLQQSHPPLFFGTRVKLFVLHTNP